MLPLLSCVNVAASNRTYGPSIFHKVPQHRPSVIAHETSQPRLIKTLGYRSLHARSSNSYESQLALASCQIFASASCWPPVARQGPPCCPARNVVSAGDWTRLQTVHNMATWTGDNPIAFAFGVSWRCCNGLANGNCRLDLERPSQFFQSIVALVSCSKFDF